MLNQNHCLLNVITIICHLSHTSLFSIPCLQRAWNDSCHPVSHGALPRTGLLKPRCLSILPRVLLWIDHREPPSKALVASSILEVMEKSRQGGVVVKRWSSDDVVAMMKSRWWSNEFALDGLLYTGGGDSNELVVPRRTVLDGSKWGLNRRKVKRSPSLFALLMEDSRILLMPRR